MGLVAFGLILIYMTINITQSVIDSSMIWILGWIAVILGVAFAAMKLIQRQKITKAKDVIIPTGLAMIALLTTAIFAPQYYSQSVVSLFATTIFAAIYMLAVTLSNPRIDIRNPQVAFIAGLLLLPALTALGLARLNFSAESGGVAGFVLVLIWMYYATKPTVLAKVVDREESSKAKKKRKRPRTI